MPPPVIHFTMLEYPRGVPLCGDSGRGPRCTTSDEIVTCPACVARLRELVRTAPEDEAKAETSRPAEPAVPSSPLDRDDGDP